MSTSATSSRCLPSTFISGILTLRILLWLEEVENYLLEGLFRENIRISICLKWIFNCGKSFSKHNYLSFIRRRDLYITFVLNKIMRAEAFERYKPALPSKDEHGAVPPITFISLETWQYIDPHNNIDNIIWTYCGDISGGSDSFNITDPPWWTTWFPSVMLVGTTDTVWGCLW